MHTKRRITENCSQGADSSKTFFPKLSQRKAIVTSEEHRAREV